MLCTNKNNHYHNYENDFIFFYVIRQESKYEFANGCHMTEWERLPLMGSSPASIISWIQKQAKK